MNHESFSILKIKNAWYWWAMQLNPCTKSAMPFNFQFKIEMEKDIFAHFNFYFKHENWKMIKLFQFALSVHGLFFKPCIQTSRFYLTGGMTNLYSFIQSSLEGSFNELFFSDASLWNQYKFIAFNIFSYNILIIYCININI